ncbi:MAG TPA: hypothetical protein VLT79_12255 [Gemmatimonadales bacterium]|nr:hypothetical protein [Gemmatimonadales bacterium]
MRVHLATRDLLFASKLRAVARSANAEIVPEPASGDVAVVPLDAPDAADKIRLLVARGVVVLAFGPHVHADALRAARDAGALAVPNSEVAERLAVLLRGAR